MARHQQTLIQPLFPLAGSDPNSILVILPTWVGDFVMATPALRAIRERFHLARISFLIEGNLINLAQGGPWMDECIPWPVRKHRTIFSAEYRAFVASLRHRHFDSAILLSNSFRSALLARLAAIGRRIGYNRDGRGWLLTDGIPVPNRKSADDAPSRLDLPSLRTTAAVKMGSHIPGRPSKYRPIPLVYYYADLVQAIGCRRPDDTLELFTTPDCDESVERRLSRLPGSGSPLIALSPGAKFGASKCWAPQRFAAAADRFVEEFNATIFITCGPGEEPIANAIRQTMKREARVMTDPLLTLGELKALIRRCDLLIANDAGPRHIAKAFGVPVVTVFGPTHPDWTATNYPQERIVRVDVDCGPCQQRVCPLGHLQCMELVSVDMVVSAARDLLSRGSSQKHVEKTPAFGGKK